ncbi:MAG: 23S rRNA (uracil(1939)-C(5))-methyltransferase RlmD [Deltaproteobacteria bacterium]|nr:23S rRNA (uracil(1939)-C(5))-methyltransferase RlmD [Deltaproteobacteria bacterium]
MSSNVIKISALVPGGYGLGRLEGKVIFVPGTLRDEVVEIEVIESKPQHSLAQLIKVIEPSPQRVSPRCPVFGQCGGCQWQHIDSTFQHLIKKDLLIDALTRIGKLNLPEEINLTPAASPWHYRHRLRLQVRGQGRQRRWGFFGPRSHVLIPITDCWLANSLVNQIIQQVSQCLPDLPGDDNLKEIEIVSSPEEGQGVVLCRFTPGARPGNKSAWAGIADACPKVKALIVTTGDQVMIVPGREADLRYTFYVANHQTKKDLTYQLPPGVFTQSNLGMNQALINLVVKLARPRPGDIVWDLFCGAGNFSLPLALTAGQLTGVESSSAAIQNADYNAGINGINNCRFLVSRVDRFLAGLRQRTGRPTIVVLDPPREGASGLGHQMEKIRPDRIIYVSCNPATLARDAAHLHKAGYRLARLEVVDMFPQTHHVETIALFEPV